MKDAIKELFPPDVPPVTRWRIAIFSVCASMWLFMCWALSPYGFALASDMNRLKGNVDEMQLTQIEQSIYSLKEWECSSTDKGAERFFSGKIAELNRRYQLLVGAKVDIPPCRSGNEPR
jgi:hypothetical protein